MINTDTQREVCKVYTCDNNHIIYVPLKSKIECCPNCGSKDIRFQQTFVDMPHVINKGAK